MPTHAIARKISRSLARCELVHLPRQPFDLGLAAQQHANYIAALERAGVRVTVLPEAPDLPDAAFVEDPVVMLDEVAVLCRPGARSREPEVALLKPALETLRPIVEIREPGTLEGGDVLCIGRDLFVGISTRSNRAGAHQLRAITAPFGYRMHEVPVTGCLHLKTAVTAPGPGFVLLNADWIETGAFRGVEILRVPRAEPWGANTLPVNDRVLVAGSAPRTAELLAAKNLHVELVDVSELQKAEAGLTCLSVLYSQVRSST